jgi:hypothetical protein
MMPEWYVVVAALAGLSLLGIQWSPLLLAVPLFLAALLAPALHAAASAVRVNFLDAPVTRFGKLKMRALTAGLHMLQPLARLLGRTRLGLTPWRSCMVPGISLPIPWPRTLNVWSEEWRDPLAWLQTLEESLKGLRTRVLRGGDFDRWDLELRGGLLGATRVLMAVEEHGGGKQLVRFRAWPRFAPLGLGLTLLFAALAAAAAVDQAWITCVLLDTLAVLLLLTMSRECGATMGAVLRVIEPVRMKKK